MDLFEKLGKIIAEEFVLQAQNQIADRMLRSARKDAPVLAPYGSRKAKAASATGAKY